MTKIGTLKEIFVNDTILWPSYNGSYQTYVPNKNFVASTSGNNTTLSFNSYPKLRVGDFAIVLDCSDNFSDGPISTRIRVLTKYGIGWVSTYMLGDR